ncbi:MAG: hypothetical protein F6K23_20525 [Okeania sp. SIO2C9]|uniref:hypothetical protein n=1 Tax=Okeania sp. SIO2C9 TaxID=2607791 RepID=UPI0013C10512|nr:hypothetical protein [Okeania sp. SIO2C9]NEQ75220.1 hypothetical protein [Okeania sp. SIO2C9]
MGGWGDGGMGRLGDWGMGRWGDGEIGRLGDGGMGRSRHLETKIYCIVLDVSYQIRWLRSNIILLIVIQSVRARFGSFAERKWPFAPTV